MNQERGRARRLVCERVGRSGFCYSQIDGTEKKLLTATTKYRIASITRTYTAVMIFQLVEEGKIELTGCKERCRPWRESGRPSRCSFRAAGQKAGRVSFCPAVARGRR